MSTNGTKNLIPMSTRSKDEVKAIAAKGGQNSGKTRRAQKTISEMLKLWCEKPANEDDKARLQEIGLSEELTNKAMLIAPLLENAKGGDVKSIRLLYELIGEDKKREQEIKKLQAENELLKLEQEQLKAQMSRQESEQDVLDKLCETILKGATNGV